MSRFVVQRSDFDLRTGRIGEKDHRSNRAIGFSPKNSDAREREPLHAREFPTRP
jgi:hypothetical protein